MRDVSAKEARLVAHSPVREQDIVTLARCLSAGHGCSLGTLATKTGASPEVVLQTIIALRVQGVTVLEEDSQTYRLGTPLDLLDGTLLRHELAKTAPGLDIEILDECESTSTLLASRLATAPSGTVITCEHQRAGRGRRGQHWKSGLAAGLTFSLLWRFGGGPTALSGLSLAVAVTVAKALERRGLAGIGLKWPNDLFYRGRKFGGILIEVSGSAQGPGTAIIGIGLNVRLPVEIADEIDRPVTDLAEVAATGSGTPEKFNMPDRTTILADVLAALAAMLPQYEHDGFSAFREDWQSRHAHQGRHVMLVRDNRTVAEGEAVGVAEDGALLLRSARGLERFHSGEVSLRASGTGS